MRRFLARIKVVREKVNCDNCKCHKIDRYEDGVSIDYCYPQDFTLLATSCENRRKNHPEQCLWLNGKLSRTGMMKCMGYKS